MIGSVGLTNIRCAEFNVLQTNDDFLVGNVKFDVATEVIDDFFISSDTDVTNDFLHSRELVDCGRDTVIVGSKLVINEASFFEK